VPRSKGDIGHSSGTHGLPAGVCYFLPYTLSLNYEAPRLYKAGCWGCSHLAGPSASPATRPVYLLGSLHVSSRTAPYHIAFYEALRSQGYIEGQNLSVDEHGYALRPNEVREHALELAKAQVDVIVCAGDPAMQIAIEATKSIPIVARFGRIGCCALTGQARRQRNRREFPRQRA
jgi:hypothetical protein